MKAEEIKRAEEFLKKKRPQDFDDIPKWHIEDMIEYAQQFQSPQISEEEIRNAACERITREKTFAIQRQVAFIQGAGWILSRLPHEQPVGKADKLEAEQPQGGNNKTCFFNLSPTDCGWYNYEHTCENCKDYRHINE